MDIFLQQVVNGLIIGSIYALIALGYTLVYGILGLINFAHGEIVMIGAMTTLTVLNVLLGADLNWPVFLLILLAMVLAMPISMLLGYSIERLAYRPLRKAPKLSPLITAIGVSIVLQNLAMIVWGKNYAPFPDILPTTPHYVLGAAITDVQIVIMVLAGVLMLALLWLIQRTRLGTAMRAVAQNPDAAKLMGVNVNAIVSKTFILGSALGAIAGVMITANYGQAHATMGFVLGLKAFSAAVLGGIGNIAGAMIGGLLLGLIESLGAGYIGELSAGFLGSHYQDVFAFLVLILVLVFKPSGLMGERVADRP